jgi:hypothetical protein
MMKKCPLCFQEIKSEAIVCRHCGVDIVGAKKAAKKANATEQFARDIEYVCGVIGSALVFVVDVVILRPQTPAVMGLEAILALAYIWIGRTALGLWNNRMKQAESVIVNGRGTSQVIDTKKVWQKKPFLLLFLGSLALWFFLQMKAVAWFTPVSNMLFAQTQTNGIPGSATSDSQALNQLAGAGASNFQASDQPTNANSDAMPSSASDAVLPVVPSDMYAERQSEAIKAAASGAGQR